MVVEIVIEHRIIGRAVGKGLLGDTRQQDKADHGGTDHLTQGQAGSPWDQDTIDHIEPASVVPQSHYGCRYQENSDNR